MILRVGTTYGAPKILPGINRLPVGSCSPSGWFIGWIMLIYWWLLVDLFQNIPKSSPWQPRGQIAKRYTLKQKLPRSAPLLVRGVKSIESYTSNQTLPLLCGPPRFYVQVNYKRRGSLLSVHISGIPINPTKACKSNWCVYITWNTQVKF